MGITLKQIAEMAGVHKSTVDKVIHNRPGVSDAKRQQIRSLLREHGYESNPLAKALNYQKKKMTVAVVLPAVDATPELRRGIELVRQDFDSFNCETVYHEVPYPDAAAQAACLRALCGQGVAGVVCSPMEDAAVYDALAALDAAHIPVVTVNSDLEDAPRLCFVGQDVEQSGKVAARLASLLLGASGEIGVLSSRESLRSVEQRKRAFEGYLTENYPAIRIAETIDTHESPALAYEGTADMLRRRPGLDGLFITCGCVPDICRAVRDLGLAGRLKILCYERYAGIVELVRGGEIACTISGDLVEQGRLAMRLLFEHIIYDRTPAQKEIYTKNEILLRENI
ncbi:LacI family DNA-binding transcriptional regulator [Intestinibacillus massiliensis]|uniref:LacI family DNA-binding transcriptional regulator n=1 Tax=Intestinibacillus massiliensis TaxID=1871029 RepID=UPI0013566820|nr:LacI family DNA-binding transcriptional regulator [Intestinibacillus massiliensis]